MSIYYADIICAGAAILGAAILEIPTTGILPLEKQDAKVDEHGNLLVQLLG